MAQAEFGYIFDFDGVLVNTMEAHYAAYSQALAEIGVPVDKKQFFRQAGMTGREQIAYFCKAVGKDADVEAIYERKQEIAREIPGRATTIPCNLQLIRMLKKEGVPIAVASGSSRPSIVPLIELYDIPVDAIASSEDVQRGKPHPDLFLCAAKKLGVDPRNCIVVEDSDVGIEAAANAGMKAMRFYDNEEPSQ